jgi:hypothetical protein
MLGLTDVLMFGLDEPTLQAQFQQPKLVLSLHICYSHAANAMNFFIVMLHTAINVPA